ncbi:MAG: hypothetical protein ACI9SD_001945 [Pseudohongiellaceae bacterium]|jgi:hypothetical protein
MRKKDTAPSKNEIKRKPFPNSKKVYVAGKIHPQINVAMREIIDMVLVVDCKSGLRSAQAIGLLMENNFPISVLNLKGVCFQ